METAHVLGKITGQTVAGDRWANPSVSHCKATPLVFPFQELNNSHEKGTNHHKPIVLKPYGP